MAKSRIVFPLRHIPPKLKAWIKKTATESRRSMNDQILVILEERSDGTEAVEGFIWCDRHGTVHDDSLDPYEYGPDGACSPEDHRPMFMHAEAVAARKGAKS